MCVYKIADSCLRNERQTIPAGIRGVRRFSYRRCSVLSVNYDGLYGKKKKVYINKLNYINV